MNICSVVRRVYEALQLTVHLFHFLVSHRTYNRCMGRRSICVTFFLFIIHIPVFYIYYVVRFVALNSEWYFSWKESIGTHYDRNTMIRSLRRISFVQSLFPILFNSYFSVSSLFNRFFFLLLFGWASVGRMELHLNGSNVSADNENKVAALQLSHKYQR